MAEPRIQNDYPETGKVIPNQLNMRDAPAGAIIKVLSRGSTVTVLRGLEKLPWTILRTRGSDDEAVYWLKVSVDGTVGYVMRHWLEFPPQGKVPPVAA